MSEIITSPPIEPESEKTPRIQPQPSNETKILDKAVEIIKHREDPSAMSAVFEKDFLSSYPLALNEVGQKQFFYETVEKFRDQIRNYGNLSPEEKNELKSSFAKVFIQNQLKNQPKSL